MAAQPDVVQVQMQAREGGRIARVTIDRREKLNALDPTTLMAATEAFRALADDEALRVAVLTGAGEKAFIGGADIHALAQLDAETARVFIASVHGLCKAIRDLPVPVVGRINGWCLGAGLEVAASCDLRIVAANAMFGMPEVRIGLPSVVEAALLPRLVGWGKARELVYLGRNYDAEAAHAMGLVERVVPADGLDAAVEEWVDDVVAAGPQAIRLQKRLVREWERLPLEEAIRAGIDSLAAAYETDEPVRMTRSFLDRRRNG